MAIQYIIESEENFLKVVAKGQDDDLNDVPGYFRAIEWLNDHPHQGN